MSNLKEKRVKEKKAEEIWWRGSFVKESPCKKRTLQGLKVVLIFGLIAISPKTFVI